MLTGKKVLVIGLARSGQAAVRLLQKLNATITINEGKDLEKIDNSNCHLKNGSIFPIKVREKKNIENKINNYIFNKLRKTSNI